MMATDPKNTSPQPAPVQEPVGEVNRYGLDSHGRKWHGIYWYDPNVDVPHGTKLYTSPQPAHQEPIYQYQMANGSWIDQTKESHDYNVRHGQATVRAVYTSPPARKPLTDEPYESPYNPNPVEYQYHYPDGSWRCSNGEVINGMHPDLARSLYALKDNT